MEQRARLLKHRMYWKSRCYDAGKQTAKRELIFCETYYHMQNCKRFFAVVAKTDIPTTKQMTVSEMRVPKSQLTHDYLAKTLPVSRTFSLLQKPFYIVMLSMCLLPFPLPFQGHDMPSFPLVILMGQASYVIGPLCSRTCNTVSGIIVGNPNGARDPTKIHFLSSMTAIKCLCRIATAGACFDGWIEQAA